MICLTSRMRTGQLYPRNYVTSHSLSQTTSQDPKSVSSEIEILKTRQQNIKMLITGMKEEQAHLQARLIALNALQEKISPPEEDFSSYK